MTIFYVVMQTVLSNPVDMAACYDNLGKLLVAPILFDKEESCAVLTSYSSFFESAPP